MTPLGIATPRQFGSLAIFAVFAALYAYAGPQTIAAEAVASAGTALLVAGCMLTSMYAAGRTLLSRVAPGLLAQPAGWAFALAVGIGVVGLVLSTLAALAVFSAPAVGVVLVGAVVPALWAAVQSPWRGSGAVVQPEDTGSPGEDDEFALRGREASRLPLPLPGWALAILAVLLVPIGILALAPPTDTDEIYQHLALARRIAEDGGLRGGFDAPEGSRPQWIQVCFAAAYSLGGAAAARFWHLGIVTALLFAAAELGSARFGAGRGTAPVLVAATSYSLLHEAGMAYNDLPAAFFLLLAAELVLREVFRDRGPLGADSGNAAALRADPRVCSANAGVGSARLPRAALIFGNFFGPRRGAEKAAIEPVAGSQQSYSSPLFGLLLGFAVTAKLTAGPAAAALGLCFFVSQVRRAGVSGIRSATVAGALSFALLAPWMLRNATSGLHPLFPYAGWPAVEGFRFLYGEKYGVGHTWGDAFGLPLDLLLAARIDTFAFLGQLSYGWAALALGAVLAAIKRPDAKLLVMVLGVGFVAWANSAQLLRYLLPLAGIAMLLGASGAWPRVALLLSLISLPANVFPVLANVASASKVVAGKETPSEYLSRELSAWPALAYLRDHVPLQERVALLYAWQDYWILQPTVLGSVEDHTPTRHWLATHGDTALTDLYGQGVRWVLVGGSGFLRKTYVFLPEPAYRQQFVEPRELLERLLLRDATRVFDEGHWAVWRLDAPRVGD